MNRDDIIRMAREAGELKCDCCLPYYEETDIEGFEGFLERFANLVAAAEREKVAAWMIQRGYATGHGDTTEDLLSELDWQIAENWDRALINGVETEREACAKIADQPSSYPFTNYGDAIRARGN